MSVYATLARFIRDSTAAGRALLTAATAGDQRTALGLGTAAQSASSDFAAAVHNHDDRYFTETEVNTLLTSYLTVSAAGTTYQPLDSDLTAIAALTTTSFGRSLLTQSDAAAARSTIGAGTSSFDGAYSSLSGIPATFDPSAHDQAWSTITSTPTTLAGYGITDAITSAAVASGYLPLTGGTLTGKLTVTVAGAPLNIGSSGSVSANGDIAISSAPAMFFRAGGVPLRVSHHAPYSMSYSPASGGTATLSLASAGQNAHIVTRPTSGNITIAFSGETNAQIFLLVLATSSTGTPGTVTLPAGITWLTNSGSAPTLSTAVSKTDSMMFMRTGASTYYGWLTGQN